jgi:hypothetical protein
MQPFARSRSPSPESIVSLPGPPFARSYPVPVTIVSSPSNAIEFPSGEHSVPPSYAGEDVSRVRRPPSGSTAKRSFSESTRRRSPSGDGRVDPRGVDPPHPGSVGSHEDDGAEGCEGKPAVVRLRRGGCGGARQGRCRYDHSHEAGGHGWGTTSLLLQNGQPPVRISGAPSDLRPSIAAVSDPEGAPNG